MCITSASVATSMTSVDGGLDELLYEHGRRLSTGKGKVRPDTRHQLRQVSIMKHTLLAE